MPRDVVLNGSRGVPALAPGASSGGTTQVTIPAGTTPGTYYFFVKADGDGAVVESQEGNNVNWRVIQVSAGQLAVARRPVSPRRWSSRRPGRRRAR